MLPRACLLITVLCLSVCFAHAETVQASAVAQTLLQDIQNARALLDASRSPWEDPAARPQSEPLLVLAGELPGNGIWVAFKPVDRLTREAYVLQRRGYIDKDAAVRQRREARELLPALVAAICAERACYNPAVTNLAVRQVAEVDHALNHLEYHSALCVLWSMADMLGLWDRQAALEIAAAHLHDLQRSGAKRSELRSKQAAGMSRDLAVIARIIDGAIGWQVSTEGLGPVDVTLDSPLCPQTDRRFADPAVLGGAFGDWRYRENDEPNASPLVFNETNARLALSTPARETQCLHACPNYRDWQRELHDYRYGWAVYKNTAAQQKVGCDWRKLEPWAFEPGAKGANNAGGL